MDRNAGMNWKKENITPQKAQRYLDTRDKEHQRKYRAALAATYAAIMRLGLWVLSPDGISFDTEGRLINGQHRMGAVVDSGTTQWFWVCRNVPVLNTNGVYTIDTMDRGATRTVGEQLQIRHGIANGTAVATAARNVAAMMYPSPLTGRTDVPRTLAILSIYQKDIAAVIEALNTRCPVKLWRKGSVYAPLVVARHVATQQIDEFMRLIGSGENLKAGTPAHSLFRWRCNDGMKATPSVLLNAVSVAAAKHYQNVPMKTLNKLSRAGVEFWLSLQPRNVEKIRRLYVPD